ncbi:RNA pyrophosphohydrolase [Roseovarius albus]|uniref:RNA pyrophosphohydrolase n=1 Tax=Roseovarius albus TaxID=1247867 RepID=A0A1X6Z5R0_9RHOB|nr:NUDIX hydrolase [Roseovarius albus]SLN41586.1 RNA pyrophosphohydrolase [Roseovarius albus]
MIRRFGKQPDPNRRYKPRPGVYAILPRGGNLLVTLQEEPEPELQLPGGGIDQGESPIEALHREVLEETGWSIARPRRLGAFRRFVYMPEYDMWAEKICMIYTAHPVRRLSDPHEPGHIPLWLAPDIAAQELGNDGDRHFVSRFVTRF